MSESMGPSLRSIPREFISQIRGESFNEYLDKYIFIKRKIFLEENYISNIEKSNQLLNPDLVKNDHEKLVKTPLPIRNIQYEELGKDLKAYINFISKEYIPLYPLVDGEKLKKIENYILINDYAGLSSGTFIYLRETDRSSIYFALPDYCLDLKNKTLKPSFLMCDPTTNIPHKENIIKVEATVTLQEDIDFGGIFNIILSMAGDLSWATPYGPYITAGLTLYRAIFGPFGKERSSVSDAIIEVGKIIISQIIAWHEQQEIKKEISAIQDFIDWLGDVGTLLDTQNPETIKFHLTEPQGILAQLNEQLGPNKYKLHSLITYLKNDGDLADSNKAYTSQHHWLMTKNKLETLFFAITIYFIALKTKISLLGTLYDLGYDEHGRETDKADPDNTYRLLDQKVKDFAKEIPELIKNVQKRRLLMIQEPKGEACEVGVSRELKTKSQCENWFDRKTSNDAIWWSLYDSITAEYRGNRVRAKEDNPSPDEYKTKYRKVNDGSGPHTIETRDINYSAWERLAFYDKGKDDEKNSISFVLHNGRSVWGGIWDGYTPYWDEINRRRAEYIKNVKDELSKWDDMPSQWVKGLEEWKKRVTPQLPASLEPIYIKEWKEKAEADPLWSRKDLEVQYRFNFSNYGKESSLSDKNTSINWSYAEQRKAPYIDGFPTTGAFLDYVSAIGVYRKFRVKSGETKERLIAKLKRESNGKFPDHFIDRVSTKYDQQELENNLKSKL